MSVDPATPQWYTVRCVFRSRSDDGFMHEERLTLWQADSFDQAIILAENEAAEYASDLEDEYVGLAEAYWLPEPPTSGAEVFSLIREGQLGTDEYLDRFFDTGGEHQKHWGS